MSDSRSALPVPSPRGLRRLAAMAALAVAGAAFALAAAAPPAAPPREAPPGPRLRIVATTGMIGDIARRVAGERGEVVSLMGPGVDPHLYRATRSDMQRLMQADLILYNGLLLEGKLTDTLVRAATAGRRVHAVSEAVSESALRHPDGDESLADPHLWMDPALWIEVVGFVRDRLVEIDAAGRPVYEAGAAAAAAEIREVDAYAARVLGSVPAAQRVLVTAHDAFGYLGRRFGYEVVGIQGLSTESEAGVRDIERIVDLVVQRKVGAIFVESSVPQRSVEAIVSGAKARGHALAIGGSLFSDAMGAPDTWEGTYVGMIDHNATTIARALGGDAPVGGLKARLAR